MYQGLVRKGQPILKQNEKQGVEYLTFPLLESTGVVKHLFSTRMGGVSKGIFSSMNVSFTRGDQEMAVKENFQRIAAVFDGSPEDFVCSDQTHTTNIRQVTAADRGKGVVCPRDYTDVDGLITDVPGLILSTFYADCVPLYFVDVKRKVIGLSHSGWKGTVGKIGQKTIEAMRVSFGTCPEDVYAAIGPSICQACYEVSEDVAEQFSVLFPEEETRGQVLQAGRVPGKYQLNLWQANRLILLEAGVLPEHLQVTDLCTCCNPAYLFSHRASEGKRGNLGAFMCICDET